MKTCLVGTARGAPFASTSASFAGSTDKKAAFAIDTTAYISGGHAAA